MPRAHRSRSRSLRIEALEPRQVLAASLKASLSSGVLKVTGTSADDNIFFKQLDGIISIKHINKQWAASQVKSITVSLKGGDDYVTLNSLANGGNQDLKEAITIKSGKGNERVRLCNAFDVYFSGKGHKLKISTDGNVTLDGKTVDCEIEDPDPPTPTPDPTPDPEPTPEPDPTPTPDPEPTPEPDPTPTPDPEPTPEPDPTPTPDPEPTPEPDPTPTPDPEPTPEPDPTDWFDLNIDDAVLRSVAQSYYQDGVLGRTDMIELLRSAEDFGAVDATELADLTLIVNTTSLFGGWDYVRKLSTYVVAGYTLSGSSKAPAITTIVGLTVGSTAAQLENLVGKWFLGLDRPTANGTYQQVAGSLFVSGAAYSDIRQGNLGDCYLMAGLAEIAHKNANAIYNMFIVNGDGTYTVRFYNGTTAEYVSVDSYLPGGGSVYAGVLNGELWVALAEKAYAQLAEMGWSRGIDAQNAYSSLELGMITGPLSHVTGQASTFQLTSTGTSFATFIGAYTAGKMIGFGSKPSPAYGGVVGSHAYAVISYDAAAQTVTLFNPWGVGSGNGGLITLNWAQITGSFNELDYTV